jgi:hypothetical protein
MKRIIYMSILSALSGFFGAKGDAAGYELAEAYTGLRNMVFEASPAQLGLKPAASEVWAVLMETGYPDAVVTLLVLADGTVSIYFSNGGGIIGLGQHPGPERASKSFLALAQQFVNRAKPTNEHPLPAPSLTRFYLLAGSGKYFAEAKEQDLGEGRHPFAPLFHKGHEVITEIRLVDEKRRAEQAAAGDAPNART